MRKSMTFFGLLTAMATVFATSWLSTGCSRSNKAKDPWATPNIAPIPPAPSTPAAEDLKAEPLAELVGYWQSSSEIEDVVWISSQYDETKKQPVNVIHGLNLSEYTGIANSIWADTDKAPLENLETKSENTLAAAKATIVNEFTKNNEKRTVTADIKVELSTVDTLWITVQLNGSTLAKYTRLSDEEGAKRFSNFARLRARKLVRYYADTRRVEECLLTPKPNDPMFIETLNEAIEARDLTCVKEIIVKKNTPVSQIALKKAVDSLDYDITMFLLARNSESTDFLVSTLLSMPYKEEIISIKGGKPFSLALDRIIIASELLAKAAPATTLKQNLDALIDNIIGESDADILLSNISNLVTEPFAREVVSKGDHLITAISKYQGTQKQSTLRLIKQLVQLGANVNGSVATPIMNNGPSTVETAAIEFGDIALIQFLKDSGTKFTTTSRTALAQMAQENDKALSRPQSWSGKKDLLAQKRDLQLISQTVFNQPL